MVPVGSLRGSEVDFIVHQRYHRCWFGVREGYSAKQECIRYVDSDNTRDLDKRLSMMGVCIHTQAPVSWCSTLESTISFLLAQRPITLILMMINSFSYVY